MAKSFNAAIRELDKNRWERPDVSVNELRRPDETTNRCRRHKHYENLMRYSAPTGAKDV